jgi:hypothetical protein
VRRGTYLEIRAKRRAGRLGGRSHERWRKQLSSAWLARMSSCVRPDRTSRRSLRAPTGSLVAVAVWWHPAARSVSTPRATNCTSRQLIFIGPGEPAQTLHRDQWAWDSFPLPEGYEVGSARSGQRSTSPKRTERHGQFLAGPRTVPDWRDAEPGRGARAPWAYPVICCARRYVNADAFSTQWRTAR